MNQRQIPQSGFGGFARSSYHYYFDRELQARVGLALREMHAGIMDEALPADFHALLARLDKARTPIGD